MKKYLFIIAAAATCLLVACSKEKELRALEEETVATVEHLPGWTYIGATNIEAKASLTDDSTPSFVWNTGDKIAIYSGDTYYVSDGLASGDNNQSSVEFAFEGEIGAGRKYFAVYPSSLVHNGTSVIDGCGSPSDNSLTVSLPSSYAISQVKDLASPVPMIAVNDPGQGLVFKSACALIRFTLTNVPKQTKSISFGFNGKKVHGLFSLTGIDRNNPDAMLGVQAANAATASDTVITVTGVSLDALAQNYVVNIPVPAGGEYKNVTITTLDNEGHKINSFRSSVRSAGNWAPTRSGRRKLSVTLPVFTIRQSSNSNNIVKAVFAPGNLRATLAEATANRKPGYASKWEFAPNQYSALGDYTDGRDDPINSLKSPQEGDVIDLFSWFGDNATGFTGTYAPESDPDRYKYGILRYDSNSSISAYYGSGSSITKGSVHLMKDWGTLTISDGNGGSYPSGTWRTLSHYDNDSGTLTAEWACLISTRTASKSLRYAKATINDGATLIARGVILFPDVYSTQPGLPASFTSGSSTHYAQNTLTLLQWERLESLGCVFLPTTYERWYDSTNKVVMFGSAGDAIYWADYTMDNSNAAGLVVTDTDVSTSKHASSSALYTEKSVGKIYSAGVRLIRVVN